MDTDVFYKLVEIKKRYKAQGLGQICQNLLALALKKKFPNATIEVKNVEGVDIIIDANDNKYAVEVKTTSGDNVNFEEKDFRGLQTHRERGYKPILAVLKIDMSKEWIFCEAKSLKPKTTLSVNTLYTDDEFKELVKDVHIFFEKILKNHYKNIMQKGPEALLCELKKEGLKYSGD